MSRLNSRPSRIAASLCIAALILAAESCKRSPQAPPQTAAPPPPASQAAVIIEFPLTDIDPPDGATARPGTAYVRWSSAPGYAGRVLWRKQSDPATSAKTADAGADQNKLAPIGPLEPGVYTYAVEETQGIVTHRSRERTLKVEAGAAFDPPIVQQQIQRDYVQPVTLTLRNNGQAPVKCAAKAVKQFPDIVADVIGPGSADQPVDVPPGGVIALTLSVTADEARQGTYDIPVEAAGATGVAKVTVRQPLVKFSTRIVAQDPRTLSKTIEVTNEGDPLADFAVSVAAPNDKEVRLLPGAKHVNLYAGRKMTFTASPVLYLEFEKLSAELLCTAAGQTQKLSLEFARPAGARLIGARQATQDRTEGKDWICTNKPDACTPVPGAEANGPETTARSESEVPDPAEDGKKFVEYLRKNYVDKSADYKYEYGAKGNKNADGKIQLDCSGFISRVLTENDYVDPNTGSGLGGCDNITKNLPKVSESEAQPGDIVVWNYHGHRKVGGTTTQPVYEETKLDEKPDHCGFVSEVEGGKVKKTIHNIRSKGIHDEGLWDEASGFYKEAATPVKGPQQKMGAFVVGYYRPRKQPKEGEGGPVGGGCPPVNAQGEGTATAGPTTTPAGGAQ